MINYNINKKDISILIISMSRWDGVVSSASFALAKELAKSHFVYYIDHPFTLKDFLVNYNKPEVKSRRSALIFGNRIYRNIPDAPNKFVAVTPKITIPINWLPAGKLYNLFCRINNWIIKNTINKLIKDNKIKNYIFFNSFNPFYYSCIPKKSPPLLYLYQSRDNIKETVYTSKHGEYLEKKAILKANVVFATSSELCKSLAKYGKNIIHLPNAVDFESFHRAVTKKYNKPTELKDISTPIIGYTGNIEKRIDYSLLKILLEDHPEKTFVFIGERNDKKYSNINFDDYQNLIFIGRKRINELPQYLHFFSCAIIPFHCNELTKSIYPLKINEYLAAGLNVISTSFSQDILSFKSKIFIAENYKEFSNLINEALTTKFSVEQKIALAKSNSWKNRVNFFWHVINKKIQDVQ